MKIMTVGGLPTQALGREGGKKCEYQRESKK